MGLKFPGKSVRRNRGLAEGHYPSPENPRIAVPQESRHSKLLFFLVHIFPAGTRTVMQMFCPAVMPSTQLGVCSDGGEALLSQVGPCCVIAEALTGGGKVLAAAGTRGKPFVFIQTKL